MKMIIAIVSDEDSEQVSHALTDAGYRVTTIASTGGFLRRGVTTLLSATEDEKLVQALEVMRGFFKSKPESDSPRCRLFVLNIAEYYHF